MPAWKKASAARTRHSLRPPAVFAASPTALIATSQAACNLPATAARSDRPRRRRKWRAIDQIAFGRPASYQRGGRQQIAAACVAVSDKQAASRIVQLELGVCILAHQAVSHHAVGEGRLG
jgi:hypothetical protein